MSKETILLMMAVILIGSVSCRDIEVKNETHIHYHKETTIRIRGELDITNIDSVKQKKSKPKKLDKPASTEDKS